MAHRFEASSGNVYQHNSDFSGYIICNSDHILFEDMLELVANYYRDVMLNKIENATPREILERLVK